MAFGFRGAGAFRLMLSSASLLFILKSGCLNSHACNTHQNALVPLCSRITYPCAVRRCASLFIIVPHFVEVVFVKLPHEAREIAVFEVFGQDVFREFLILFPQSESPFHLAGCAETCLQNHEAVALVAPSHYVFILRALQHPTRVSLWSMAVGRRSVLVELPHLYTVSMALLLIGRAKKLTKSLELLADWPLWLPSIFTRSSAMAGDRSAKVCGRQDSTPPSRSSARESASRGGGQLRAGVVQSRAVGSPCSNGRANMHVRAAQRAGEVQWDGGRGMRRGRACRDGVDLDEGSRAK